MGDWFVQVKGAQSLLLTLPAHSQTHTIPRNRKPVRKESTQFFNRQFPLHLSGFFFFLLLSFFISRHFPLALTKKINSFYRA